MASKFQHAERFAPGDYIREQLEIRNWTQADLAAVLGVSQTHVNDILNAKVNISADIAKGLNDAFGMTAEYWAELDKQYRLDLAKDVPERGLRGRLFNRAPVNQLIKRNWIAPSASTEVLETYVCKFLGIGSLEDEPVPFPHAAKKMSYAEEPNASQVAWLCRVNQIAMAAPVTGPFRAEQMPQLIGELKRLARLASDVRQVPALLAGYGIRFLVVEPLPGGKIDGVTFWPKPSSPVIAISLRLGSIANFWQVLLHEIKHVLNGDGKDGVPCVDLDVDGASQPPLEREANRFAVETLIPAADLEAFKNRVRPGYTIPRIDVFAERMGVHRGIVIAQLAFTEKELWRFGSRTNMPLIRDYVTETALTDGWGHPLPSFAER